jgi:hypothetical protein
METFIYTGLALVIGLSLFFYAVVTAPEFDDDFNRVHP